MKQLTALSIALILTVAATPAFAAPKENKDNNGNGNANGHNKQEQSEKKAEGKQEVKVEEVAGVSIAPSEEPTVTTAPSQVWKNHGQYVSSVAKTHPGGQVVSAAARSDIGKKHKNPTPSISPAPSASPSVAPSVAPSIEPSVVPTISTTPPITSPVEGFVFGNPLENFMTFIQNIGRFLNPFKTA